MRRLSTTTGEERLIAPGMKDNKRRVVFIDIWKKLYLWYYFYYTFNLCVVIKGNQVYTLLSYSIHTEA